MDTKISRRVGGRSALVLSAVRRAVEELVKEVGRERVTIPLVAERAGVNPTSIYRRWGDLSTLINEMATYRLDPARALPDSGTLEEDLIRWADEIVRHYRKPVNAALLRGGAAAAGQRESDCLRNRRVEAESFIERARQTAPAGGTASAVTVQDVVDYVVAPIVHRVIWAPWELTDDLSRRLVGRLFRR